MTLPRRTPRRAAALAGAALAVALAAVAPPAATAEDPVYDPALYDAGLPDGVVEHGVIDFRLTGSPVAQHSRTEYWASNERWRTVTTHVPTGLLMNESFGTEHGQTWFTLRTTAMPPRGAKPSDGPFWSDKPPTIHTTKTRATPPYAGHPAAYNRQLIEKGIVVPVGPATVAGVAGTRYVVPPDMKSTNIAERGQKFITDVPGAGMELILENGTLAPLAREITLPDNGEWGDFSQREELLKRERSADDSGLHARLSQAAYKGALKAWHAKVRKAKARAKAKRDRRG